MAEKKVYGPSGTAKVKPTSDILQPIPQQQLPGTGLAALAPHSLRVKTLSFSPTQSLYPYGNAPDSAPAAPRPTRECLALQPGTSGHSNYYGVLGENSVSGDKSLHQEGPHWSKVSVAPSESPNVRHIPLTSTKSKGFRHQCCAGVVQAANSDWLPTVEVDRAVLALPPQPVATMEPTLVLPPVKVTGEESSDDKAVETTGRLPA